MNRRRRHSTDIVNLDSLTDILTNTVGIVIFLMIFAVITARGTHFTKKFPMREPTTKDRVVVTCYGNMVSILEFDALITEFLEPLDAHNSRSSSGRYNNIPSLIEELNNRELDNGLFRVSAEADYTSSSFGWSYSRQITQLDLIIEPSEGMSGEYYEYIDFENSRFRRTLSRLDKNSQYLLFLVDPYSLDSFREGRRIAGDLGFATNWLPDNGFFWPLRYSLLESGGGGGAGSFDVVQTGPSGG